MRGLVGLLLVLPGCVEYGSLHVESVLLELRVEGAQLWVHEVRGGLDWSRLYLHVEDCTDPDLESVLHVGNEGGAVSRGANAKGSALNHPPAKDGVLCGDAIDVRLKSDRSSVRYGDFLELCTTPKGRDGTMHDVALHFLNPAGGVVGEAFVSEDVPSCRQ